MAPAARTALLLLQLALAVSWASAAASAETFSQEAVVFSSVPSSSTAGKDITGGCVCDVTPGACDANCCCDADCSTALIAAFTTAGTRPRTRATRRPAAAAAPRRRAPSSLPPRSPLRGVDFGRGATLACGTWRSPPPAPPPTATLLLSPRTLTPRPIPPAAAVAQAPACPAARRTAS